MSLASLIKRLQDIMRKDSGVDGDAQRLAQRQHAGRKRHGRQLPVPLDG